MRSDFHIVITKSGVTVTVDFVRTQHVAKTVCDTWHLVFLLSVRC